MTAEWRKYATPEEIAEHDGLIADAKANATRRARIRNRCRMRGKTKGELENQNGKP